MPQSVRLAASNRVITDQSDSFRHYRVRVQEIERPTSVDLVESVEEFEFDVGVVA